ncbi:P-loop containing nucleoside triphosphate hydrolase protein [Mycena metata]|uniref:P-loop containing nucleoside triphosphate hydrolase protein n=1 Tax=Mycena metata TaxID=1033252 RepID=A0AAD7MZ15_9AGAR|nr:P-loop containing nucleoside triphosphate hydrolase protein [Mycena metata]
MLPAEPKIFHGRAVELEAVVKLFRQGSPRIAILGGGGMGKTSLAKAVLHHPDVSARYEHRFFVATDSAATQPELLDLVASHIGLRPTKDLDTIVRHLLQGPPCLLVLDNLETSWEPRRSQTEVEEFISRVVEVPGLALIITMRGAERPAKVHWTHPFLPPLKPLPIDAARQTFIDIADSFHPSDEVEQLLRLTDCMPLAVNLIAHLVDDEGSSAVLARWENEKISLLSAGHDKRSNLEVSIQISLSSSRLTSQPGAKDLLALLSILPDGLSDVELLQMKLPIKNIRASRSTLLSTCLAYIDEAKRLRVLGPIRQHVQKSSPPSPSLLRFPREYFGQLLNLYSEYWGTENPASHASGLVSNLANIHQTFRRELHADNADLADAIRCVIEYTSFRHLHGYGYTDLFSQVEALLPQACDDHLEIEYIARVFQSYMYYPVSNPDLLVKRGLELLPNLTDPERKCAYCRDMGIGGRAS